MKSKQDKEDIWISMKCKGLIYVMVLWV